MDTAERLRHEAGSTLVIALLATLLISALGVAMAGSASVDSDVSAHHHAAAAAFYAADGGSRAAFDAVLRRTRALGRFPTTAELGTLPLPSIDRVAYTVVDAHPDGAQQQAVLDSGLYQGLTALSMPFAVSVTATRVGFPPASATIDMRAFIDMIPVFQFAVFYEKDLEVSPGPVMQVNGRVHTNSDLYVDSSTQLYFQAGVTVAGRVYNRPEVVAPMGGNVYFRDSLGNDVAMAGLDSAHPDWYAQALDRWDGNLRSDVHGVDSVSLSIERQDQPRIILEPGRASDSPADAASKLYFAADLRIVNGVATDALGNPVSLIDPVSGQSVVRPTVIHDLREGHEMLTLELDVERLGNLPDFPANGTVYIASAQPGDGIPNWPAWPAAWAGYTPWYDGGDTAFAVKLANGATLPAPLTVVTDNPGYLRGDFNTVDKKGAAFMADAITLLSNNWGRKDAGNNPLPAGAPDDDLGYSQLPFASRVAASTTYNLALAFGATEGSPAEGNNGGLENAMRFHEAWAGRTATYLGSIVVLWYPTQAYSAHLCCGYTYNAPSRNYGFDTDFLDPVNLPPSTPSVYRVRLTNWDPR